MLTFIGKTILASVIIDDCMLQESFTTAYFYCKDDEQKNNCISIFKGLIIQLLSHCRDLVPFCHDKYSSSGETTLSSARLTNQLLELLCKTISKQYIIIDGLDVCDVPERSLVLSFFKTLVDRSDTYEPGKLRVLFISQ